MYGKAKDQPRLKQFDGTSVVDFEDFLLSFMIQADRTGASVHFKWKPEDVRADGSVPEEVFPFRRPCPPGQEEAYATVRMEDKRANLQLRYESLMAAIRDKNLTRAVQDKYEADFAIDLIKDQSALESGFEKSVFDLRAACVSGNGKLPSYWQHLQEQ